MWYPPCRPALVPSNGSPLASACLMPPPYPPTLRPRHLIVSSHRSCLAACRSLRASSRSAPSSMSVPVLLPSHCFSLPAPPHRHDGRGDTTGLRRFSRLCLLILSSARHLISAVRHRMATGLNACLAPWPSSVPPANRSLAQSDFLAVLSSCRPIISSPSLPDHSTRGTGRGSLVLAACLCCSISPAIYLCWFCVLRRRWLSCLLGCRIMYVVDGVMR